MTTTLAQITNPVLSPQLGAGNGGSALALLMANLFRTATIVGGLALLLYIAWGGVSWITAGGDKDKVEKARDRITQGIIGMAILVATLAIANLLSPLFGFNLLSPSFVAL